MKLLILHRVPYSFIEYHRVIDHGIHDVVYVGSSAQLATVPPELPCTRVERPGRAGLAEEVRTLFSPDDAFGRVISVSQYEMMEAAQIRRSLGVEGVSPEQVHIVNDKVAMKAAVAGCGLRVPRFVRCDEALTASSADVTPWAGKTVLKPLDGTASKDVFVFATYADAGTAILNHPTGLEDWDPERFQLEEYVEGPIFHFDGVMLAGAPVAIVASRYLGTCLEFAQGVPQGSIQVDDDGGRCKVAVEYLRAVGIDNGPFHLEMIEAADGMVFLEVGARPGGGHIKETFRLATGIDLVAAGLACNLDWSPLEINPLKRWFESTASSTVYGDFMFPGHLLPSRYCAISGGERFQAHPDVVRWKELEAGASLPETVSYFDFELPVSGIVAGRSSSEVTSLIREILTTVQVVPIEQPTQRPTPG
ncbi:MULTISPECIES: acetyl-CoA carboxylase biotin carboxylase subunit family protein [unclassified Rhodococcus (in: high G+C Gram-positive bacteria)]|uniref:ATP-grasp domain-containing protein n=1 Tax=unclassified Rhodococcus (in: high G+C Gram-positive bacteria) TaxID=192944 RepID=UPI00037D7EF9|nr:carboxylate--amine ligase [Rhodococcus sp. DK17]